MSHPPAILSQRALLQAENHLFERKFRQVVFHSLPFSMPPVSFSICKFSQMRKMGSVGRARYDWQSRTAVGHVQRVEYIAAITI